MFSSIMAEKAIPLIESNTCLETKENKEFMINFLMQIQHFYTLIRYESQKEYLVEFMKRMQLKKFARGSIIYEKGTQNEGLYLVLKGSVSLWEPKTQGEINNEIGLITKLQKFSKTTVPTDEMKKKIYQTQFQLDFFRKKEDDELFKHQTHDYFLTENICSLKRIRNSNAGDSLNDDCVLSGTKTQYTVMSMDDCYLLYMSAHDYLKIFDLEINKLNFILDVLKKNFSNSKIDSLRRLSYKFKEEVFPYGSMIFHQNDPSNIFMIVHSGSVEISKITYPGQIEEEQEQCQQNKLKTKKKVIEEELKKQKKKEDEEQANKGSQKNKRKKQKSDSQDEEEQALMEYEKYYGNKKQGKGEQYDVDNSDNDDDEINMSKVRDEEEQIGSLKQKQRKKGGVKQKQESITTPVKYFRNSQCLKLGIIGPGEVVGLEDYIKHRTRRSFQAQSISADTLIYYVSKSRIDDIIDLNEDFNLKRAIKQSGNAKIDWYSDQQNKISHVNSINEFRQDSSSSALTVKQVFGNLEEDINFKSVVKKLFTDRRTKLVHDIIRKEANQSPIRIKHFPTFNQHSDYSSTHNMILQSNTNTSAHSSSKLLQLKGQNHDNQGQQQIQDQSGLTQKKSKQNIDDYFIVSSNSYNQLQNAKQVQQNMKFKKLQAVNEDNTNEISQQQQSSSSSSAEKKQIKFQEMDKQAEYENRFRTIMESESSSSSSPKKRMQTEQSSQRKLKKNTLQIQSHNNLETNDMLANKKEMQLLRNYKLETACLSLKQKIMYKIENNIILSQKYKKYDAENSRGFLETKQFVKRLRESQQSKTIQQGNILKTMREERQLSMSSIMQKGKMESQNSSSRLVQHQGEGEEEGQILKRINQQRSLSYISSINDVSHSILKLPIVSHSHFSFIDQDDHDDNDKQYLIQKHQEKLSSFPAIISSIQLNHIDIKHRFKTKSANNLSKSAKNQNKSANNQNKSANNQNKATINQSEQENESKSDNKNIHTKYVSQFGQIEDRINSIEHFQTPKKEKFESNRNKVISFSAAQISENVQYGEQNQISGISTEPTFISEWKQYSHKRVNSLDHIPEYNSSLLYNIHTTTTTNQTDHYQLPQLNSVQTYNSILQGKAAISPSISFSVKMSRKNINQKYHNIYAANANTRQKANANTRQKINTEHQHNPNHKNQNNNNYNNNEGQGMLNVNKLDVVDNLKQKILKRQEKLQQQQQQQQVEKDQSILFKNNRHSSVDLQSSNGIVSGKKNQVNRNYL